MAELNIFHYIPKNSVIHRMDGRIKLICMILFSVTLSSIFKIPDFIMLNIVLAITLMISQLPIIIILKEIKYFSFLIMVVLLVHAFSIPGTPIPYLPIHGLTFEGITSGVFFGWRLILIIIICTIFTGTTPLSLVRNVIEWFLGPVPFIPAARVGTMFSLTFVLIPLIFDQALTMLDAQKARCIESRKSPLKWIMFMTFPLLFQTLLRADEIALAMEARCYSEDRTKTVFKTSVMDWLLLVFSVLICSIVLFHTYIGSFFN